MQKALKAVLFDLDDTFYPFQPCHEAGLEAAYALGRSFGLFEGLAAFKAAYARQRSAVWARLGEKAASHDRLLYFQGMVESVRHRSDTDLALALSRAYWHAYLQAMPALLDPHAERLLTRLREAGLRLGLVTDMLAEVQFEKLRLLGLSRLFDVVVTSEEAGADKPAQEVMSMALAKLCTLGPETLMVGDNPERDGKAAQAAGLAFAWLCRGSVWPMGQAEPSVKIGDFSELSRWLGVSDEP